MHRQNLILNADSYKASHVWQYPAGSEVVNSYIESRGGDYPQLVFFGLQMFIKQYLLQPISQADIDEAQQLLTAHGLPFYRQGWQYILEQHRGYLPLQIEALPEGTVIEPGQCLVQVRNTDSHCAWLTSYLETALLRAIWYPTTVATVSYQAKCLIAQYLQQTADDSSGLPFKLHDFGARGASSQETAAIGGLAHLLNFQGTDTLAAVVAAQRYYHEPMAAFSIPAAEHSTITSWGREHEADAYRNMLQQFGGEGKTLAIVSDSYDLFAAIDTIYAQELKALLQHHGGTTVIRPDSGDPVQMVCQTIERLMLHFGYHTNHKGYRVLPHYLRVIQGDGINLTSIRHILAAMQQQGLSADNIAFGMGAELLQKVNRDTLRFAMKASAIQVNGQWREVYKAPITDQGKTSKKGILAVINQQGRWQTLLLNELQGRQNQLRPVYHNGELLIDETLRDIRARCVTVNGQHNSQ